MNITIARGSHYQSPQVYDFFTILKLRQHSYLRYRIAAQYVRPGESVLDVCAGYGEFRKFIPPDCYYQAVEASPSFLRELSRKGIPVLERNLHKGVDAEVFSTDVITMIISLCHFQNTTLHQLLEDFKTMAKKVVIVEDVLPDQRKASPFIAKIRDYLCSTEYYLPMQLFSASEFQTIMQQHGYNCRKYNERYSIGYYQQSEHKLNA